VAGIRSCGDFPGDSKFQFHPAGILVSLVEAKDAFGPDDVIDGGVSRSETASKCRQAFLGNFSTALIISRPPGTVFPLCWR